MDSHARMINTADLEDQGIEPDISILKASKKCLQEPDDDDVFLAKDEIDGKVPLSSIGSKPSSLRRKNAQPHPVSPTETLSCTAQWSVSHRCLDCAWKRHRGGRPHHPPPAILSIAPVSPPLINLHSLGSARDSGYEPSPTSAFSFTFTSEDDDDNDIEDYDEMSTSPDFNTSATDVDDSPHLTSVSKDELDGNKSKPIEFNKVKCLESDSQGETPTLSLASPGKRNKEMQLRQRSKSLPEIWANEPVFPCAPIIVRKDDFRKPTPSHGRNFSLPATTPDGRPIFASSTPSTTSRASGERLIDLTEEDTEGGGHHRRVLVLALPDLLVDHDFLKQNESPLSSSSNLLSPDKSFSSCESTSSNDTQHSLTEGYSSSSPLQKSANLDFTRSYSSSHSTDSSDPHEGSVVRRSRPTWRRPRALSCDVTLEVEFGQELRRVADNFTKTVNGWDGGVWRTLRDSFGRRFSIASCPPMREGIAEEELVEQQNVAHSLPTSSFWFP